MLVHLMDVNKFTDAVSHHKPNIKPPNCQEWSSEREIRKTHKWFLLVMYKTGAVLKLLVVISVKRLSNFITAFL
jgi:hypothetical protein